MTFRIAVVQPISHPPGEDEANVADAVRYVESAAAQGADFVCFPETYPGPWRMAALYDPTPAIAEAAVKHGVHVVYGTIEPIDRTAETAYNLICMAYPDGRAPARYRRTHPNGPWIYTGGPWWEFQYVPGDEFPVFETKFGRVGLAMCSEVYVPEVAHADLGARHRELGARGDHAEPVQPFRARARHGGRAGGDLVRKHRRRACGRGRKPRARAPDARWPRRGRRVQRFRRQAGRARSAMAAPRALRHLPSTPAAPGGGVRRRRSRPQW